MKPGFVRIEVKDDGIGISRNSEARIFQKFAQADSKLRYFSLSYHWTKA
ncbi:hypothetical protein EJG51_014390 [Undibacterium piscinae]|uniref:Histidine kinase/HSP90-like ATPase domain-containing protein n=1 Tax=Undibacterium piscinae TaxID=2495591 RepID=A0A6M4AA28_9BURK|nr:hypothetical protein EJG51_014390 [Undibacterium piscinae]